MLGDGGLVQPVNQSVIAYTATVHLSFKLKERWLSWKSQLDFYWHPYGFK
jgi:hypothetical protein